MPYPTKTAEKLLYSQNWAAVGQKPIFSVQRKAPVEILHSFPGSECCCRGGKNAVTLSSPQQHYENSLGRKVWFGFIQTCF
uniref:Uncharacterized protein n=1 Tax=Malurus cyaneus samueli TaxID=2593467 RepID=A0A8C5UJR2_9PASS